MFLIDKVTVHGPVFDLIDETPVPSIGLAC